jgi:hypothetical protein
VADHEDVPLTERKWQARVVPAKEQQWDTFLNVVQAHDPEASLANTLVRDSAGEAEGVLVHRGGANDAVVMFNAKPGLALKQPTRKGALSVYAGDTQARLEAVRLRSAGYTMTWSASTTNGRLSVALRPDLVWSVRVDGVAILAAPLSVSSEGSRAA